MRSFTKRVQNRRDRRTCIISSKCAKCIYENKKTCAQGNKKTGNEETNKKPKDNVQESKEAIEWVYIDAEQSKFAVDGIPVDWDSAPILDAGDVTQINKFLKHTDNIDDVTDAGKRVLKHSSRYVQSVKDSIKNVNDLKSMIKYPEIFTDDAIEHVFLGNSKGGFHYNGLSISKGKILNKVGKPDSNGVYEAFVEINGKQAKKNKNIFPR